jgi:hypothetical protein
MVVAHVVDGGGTMVVVVVTMQGKGVGFTGTRQWGSKRQWQQPCDFI